MAQARGGPAIVWTDSKSYAVVAAKPFWSEAFWVGQRPPLDPLLIKVFGADSGLLTAQAVIAAVAWGVLAWTVGRLVAPGWRRVVAFWVILAFATSFPITLWNRSVLSESLSMSMLALVFAGFLWTAQRITWPRVVATVAACLCFATTRDAQVWTVAILGLGTGVYSLTRINRNRRLALRTGVLAMCLLTVVGVTEWGAVASHRTVEDVADVFYVRIFPFPDRVAWFAAHGMPQQRAVDALARATGTEGTAKVVGFSAHDPAFRRLERWIAADGSSTYLLWLATHPWYVVSEPLQRPERSFNFAQGNLNFYATTTNQMKSPLTVVLWPPLLELIILSALALYLAVLSGSWRLRPWRMALALSLTGMLAMLAAWHGDGQEVTRHTIEGYAQVRLGVWILIVVGLLSIGETEEPVIPVAVVGDQREVDDTELLHNVHFGRTIR